MIALWLICNSDIPHYHERWKMSRIQVTMKPMFPILWPDAIESKFERDDFTVELLIDSYLRVIMWIIKYASTWRYRLELLEYDEKLRNLNCQHMSRLCDINKDRILIHIDVLRSFRQCNRNRTVCKKRPPDILVDLTVFLPLFFLEETI